MLPEAACAAGATKVAIIADSALDASDMSSAASATAFDSSSSSSLAPQPMVPSATVTLSSNVASFFILSSLEKSPSW